MNVTFRWEGVVSNKRGRAVYELGDEQTLVLRLPSLQVARQVHQALEFVYSYGLERGVSQLAQAIRFAVEREVGKLTNGGDSHGR
jgi:hypothetical protein